MAWNGNQSSGGQSFGDGSSVGVGDILTALKILNQNMSQLIQAVKAGFPPVTLGAFSASRSFTLDAAAITVVPNSSVSSSSVVVFAPTNAAAATLVGSGASLYVSSLAPGSSFTVATANGTAAHGTETFSYSIAN